MKKLIGWLLVLSIIGVVAYFVFTCYRIEPFEPVGSSGPDEDQATT